MLRYTTDRARPGLVALYDIQAWKWSGSILTTPEPTRGHTITAFGFHFTGIFFQMVVPVVQQLVHCTSTSRSWVQSQARAICKWKSLSQRRAQHTQL